MAENVNIVGFPGSVLKDALKDVPPWATEKTAQRIEVLLSRNLKAQSQASKDLVESIKSAIKQGTDISLDPLHDYLDELSKAEDQLKENAKLEEQRQQRQEEHIKKDLALRNRATETLIAGLVKFTTVVKNTLATNIGSFSQLDRAGVSLSSGFGEIDSGFKAISTISKNTGVRISELNNLLSQYSTAINVAGMSKFTQTISESSKNLNQFGFTNKEATELLGAYLETERLRGEDSTRSQFTMRRQLEQFGKSVRELGKTSGQAREQILANLKAQSASTDSLINSIRLGADAGKNIDLFISSLKDQELGRKISGLMTAEFKTLNKTYMDLVRTGNGAIASSLATVTESIKSLEPEEQKRVLMEWAAANETALDQAAIQARRMQEAGVEGASESLATIRELKTELKSYRQLTDEERRSDQRAAEASSALSSEFEKLKAQLTILITPVVGLIGALTSAIAGINTVIDTVSSTINAVFGSEATNYILQSVAAFGALVGGALALAKGFGILKAAIALFRSGILKSIVSGISGTATSTVARGAATAATTGISGTVAGGAAAASSGIGKTIASLGTGVAGIIGSLGKGAGSLIRSVLMGAALGISAFANPLVLKGALILAGSLAIISGGIRLSAFILGDSLKNIAEGLGSFASVDGVNLLKVGAGVGALGAGLAVFTAGSTIANVGSIISGLTDGFRSLLGISGPVDKLKSFAELGPGLEMAGAGLIKLSGSMSLLSATIEHIPDSKKIGNIIKEINSLSLVKASALGALLSFEKSDNTTPGTKKSSEFKNIITTKYVAGSRIGVPEAAAKEKTESAQTVEQKQTYVSTADRTETVDINSMINQQNLTLMRLLENAETQLSVSREMLKFISTQ